MSIRTSPPEEFTRYIPFQTRLQVEGDRIFAEIFGELDLATVPLLRDSLSPHAGSYRAIVYEVAGLTFIDGTGLRGMVSAFEGTCEGGEVLIRNPSRSVRRLLELLELESLISNGEISMSALVDLSTPEAGLELLRNGRRHGGPSESGAARP